MRFIVKAGRPLIRGVIPVLAAFGLLSSSAASAQGDLLVAPTRVIINNLGTAEVILSNIGDKDATYRVGLELRRMNEQGELDPVEPDAASDKEKAALDMVRYAPRRVVLPPGQPQSIRISARPPAGLPDGEYRVHMTFAGQPEVKPVEQQPAEGQAPATGLQINLIPVYSITIPIIVRLGKVEASATISNPRIAQDADGHWFLKLDMARSGNGSVFGEIRITHPGQSDPVFLARGIAIYPEVDRRELILPVSPEQAAAMKGPVKVEYREFPENGGALLASVEGTLG
jgi:hypothetical protein